MSRKRSLHRQWHLHPTAMRRATATLCLALLLTGCGLFGGSGGSGAETSPTSTATSPPATPAPSAIDSVPPSQTGSAPPAPSTPSATSPPEEENPGSDGEPGDRTDADVRQLLERMTMEEKIGQMLLAGVDGKKFDGKMRRLVQERRVGGIIMYKNNFSGLEGSVNLVNGLKAANTEADAPLPLFISVDEEGGKVSRLPEEFTALPSASRVGRANDAALANEMGALLSRQLTLMGFNVDFAPVLDVNSNPDNPIIGSRAFGTTADIVGKAGVAVMKGLREGGTIPVVKHFPGHGDTAVDSHLELPVVDKTTEQLRAMEWVPFQAAIAAGADVVMVAHILFPQIDPDYPASLSPVIIGEQLRGQLGFKGVVITDDMTMDAIADHYGMAEAAVHAVKAGSDILLVAHGYDTADKVFAALQNAVLKGEITEDRIDESVARIIALKGKYALTDEPIAVPAKADLPNDATADWLRRLEAATGSRSGGK